MRQTGRSAVKTRANAFGRSTGKHKFAAKQSNQLRRSFESRETGFFGFHCETISSPVQR